MIVEYGDLVVAVGALAVAATVALARRRGLTASSFVVGALLVSAWATASYVLDLVTVDPGVRYTFLDVLITLGVGAYAAARWGALTEAALARLGALVLFAWLVSTKGDVFTIVGGWLTVPSVFLVVLGVVLTLLGGSAFARRDSAGFPRASRVLLWVGYLVLNLALLNWVQVTRGFDLWAVAADKSVFYVGLPMAAWLVIARGFHPDSD